MRLCIGNAHNAGADVFHNFVPAAEIRISPKPVYAGRLGGVKSAVDPPAGKSRVLMLPARSFSRKHPEPCPTSLKITCWRVWPAVAAPPGAPVESAATDVPKARGDEKKLDELLGRVKQLVGDNPAPAAAPTALPLNQDAFVPFEPATLREAELSEALIEELILKYLLSTGNATGRLVADQVKLPFKLVEERLRQIKSDQLVVYRGAA